MIYKLIKPVMFDGKEVTEINLDLEGLTGDDLINVERQFTISAPSNETIALKELSKEYQILVAARAAKMPVEFFRNISAKDFSRITVSVQRFFLE